MATTAQWGDALWGDAEWGSIESGDGAWASNIGMELTVSGSLTAEARFEAAVAMSLAVAGNLTTQVLMTADVPMQLTLGGPLRVARFAGGLQTCGEPLTTACQEWLLDE